MVLYNKGYSIALLAQNWTKTSNFQTVFSQDWETFLEIFKCRSNRNWKGFIINYRCTDSNDYLWCAKISEFAKKRTKKRKNLNST